LPTKVAESPTPEDVVIEESKELSPEKSMEVDQLGEDTHEISIEPPAIIPKSSPEITKPAKKVTKKTAKAKEIPASEEESADNIKDVEPDFPLDTQSEEELKSDDLSSRPLSSTSEAKSTSKEADSIKSQEDKIQPVGTEKTKPEKKMTMDEKIAAQKAKQGAKEEEPSFTGMKLKKSKPLQRQWTEKELEVVELKAHKFEQLPQIEMVKMPTSFDILLHY
jgi:hypothetical protein